MSYPNLTHLQANSNIELPRPNPTNRTREKLHQTVDGDTSSAAYQSPFQRGFSLRDQGLEKAFLGTWYRGWNTTATRRSLQACIPGTWLEALNWILLLCASVVVIHSTIEYTRVKDTDDPNLMSEKRCIIGAALSAAAVFIWPVVLGRDHRICVAHARAIYRVGFAWPMCLWSFHD